MVSELRDAFRSLTRRPRFAVLVLVTLAIGIGASTAIFSIVHTVILKPLPFADPDRLVHIYENRPKGERFSRGAGQYFIVVRPATLHAWRTQSRSFASIEGYRRRGKTLGAAGGAEPLWAHEVTEGFFATTGAAAALGRTFVAADYSAGPPAAVVLSHRLWQTRFGADARIVGQTVQIDGASVPVVGVMPPGFYATRYDSPDVWLPYWSAPGAEDNRVAWTFLTLARLRDGVTFEQAQLEMDVISDRLSAAFPNDYDNMNAVLVPAVAEVSEDYERLLYTLLGAVGLVLLVGCVNVANLMLSRGIERNQEFAVRSALGASRGRLIRLAVIESLLIALVSGALGLAVAWASLPAALALLPADNPVPRLSEVTLNPAVLSFAVCISAIVGVVCGLVPAFRVAGTAVNHALRDGGRGAGPGRGARRFGDSLVAIEIALALTLSIAAGLMLRSFTTLQAVDSGFDTERVLSLELTVPTHRYGAYENGGPNPPRARLYQDLARQIGALPGVESAAVTASLPLRHGVNPWGIRIAGRPAPAAPEPGGAAGDGGVPYHGSVSIERVTAGYFQTLGVRVLRGRPIDDRDDAGAPVVTVVNDTFARKFFPDADPIGQQFTVDMTSYEPRMTIVGVVEDNKMHGLDRAPYPLLYWSMSQLPSTNGWLVVRTHGQPEALADRVRTAVTRLDPELAIGDTAGLERVLRESTWRPRFAALLLALFAALGLFQAVAGIYAVMSYAVARRTQEVGLRVTLGARPREILSLILTHALRLAAAGLILGIAAALSLRQLVASQLFGVSSSDPTTLAAVSGIVLVVALAAAAVPAFRALRVDPVLTLRQQ